MDAGDDQGTIEEAENSGANGSEGAGHGGSGSIAYAFANPATERAYQGMGQHHCHQQGNKRHYDHVEVGRDDAL
ncbi:hypothetical protein D3C79_862480 [compost metagenome]